MKNIGEILVLNANRYPEKTAILYQEQRLTYRELNERVNRLSHHLADLGVRKGDRVGFMLYNSNQFVEIFFATVKLGAIAVPFNFRLVPREIKWALDHIGCKIFAYSQRCATQVEPIKEDIPNVEHLIYSGETLPPGEHHFEMFTREGDVAEPVVQVGTEDPAYLIFTGGTTGLPKAAVHTHHGSIADAVTLNLRMKMWDPDQVHVTQVPMFHIGGLGLMRSFLLVGGMQVLLETFDPLEILRVIDQEKATYITLLPPATYIRLMDLPNIKDYDLSSVMGVGGSAGVLPKALMLRLLDTFPNAFLLYGWGSTEMGNGGTQNLITRALVESDSERIRSVGREVPFLEARLVDEKGKEVPVGEIGEAVVRGPSVMKEYFNQPELTTQVMKDGWFHTGDILRKDQDGFYYFADRKKDMIKTGGENVFAPEVETVIMSHPAVELCAVIGVRDPVWSEAVMAVIKLRKSATVTEEEIVEHCKLNLSSYKKPRRIAFVDSFPQNDVGKILKFKLREQYSQ
jgi:acyl-CoA synthetase (AMP-forming)/AMP-acid ligase II